MEKGEIIEENNRKVKEGENSKSKRNRSRAAVALDTPSSDDACVYDIS